MGFRPPGGDNASFIIVAVGIDHRDFHTIHQANGIDSNFAIVETVINPSDRSPFENPLCILEGNPVLPDILAVLFFVPIIPHNLY
jgi:hypothetical protein